MTVVKKQQEGKSDMEQKKIREIVRQIRVFRKEITVEGVSDSANLLRDILLECPELQYYIAGMSCLVRGRTLTIQVRYRNINYPFGKIITDDIPDMDHILEEAVSRFRTKIVIAAPEDNNIKWKIDYFYEKNIYRYPQIESIGGRWYCRDDIPYVVYEMRLKYHMEAGRLIEMNRETEKAAKHIARQLFPIEMPESAKCYIAHNYLASTVRYQKPEPDDPVQCTRKHSAYGALIEKGSVCHGFAHAYRMIMELEGISCDIVNGKTKGRKPGNHAWNIIHFSNGKSVHVDVTHDAGKKKNRHRYCFISDVSISQNHEWDTHYYCACVDGKSILEEAREFCSRYREALLRRGLRPEWID